MPGTDRPRPRADRARQIAEVLRRQVGAGAFSSGVLPDERHLIADFGASRNAVRDARMVRAPGAIAARLGLAEGTTVAYVERVSRLSGGRPVDLEFLRIRGDRLTLHGELPRA